MIAAGLEWVLTVTLVMAMVLAVRQPVAQLFGAEWAYALWLLPVLVPLLPPLPAISAAPAVIILPAMSGDAAATAGASSSAASGAEWLLMLLALWGGGAAVFGIWQQSTHSAFMLHLGPDGRRAAPPSFGGIKVVESDAVDGPIAVGILNRRIVVPADFSTRYSAAEQRLALEHELVHHRRLDLVWNWVGLGILTLNWFNPIAHVAFRAFRADQELACDAAVTRRAPAERHDYALALVKSASRPGLIAVCPLNHASMLKRRLRMMKQHRASWARTIGGVASVALVGAVGLAFASPSFAEEQKAAQIVMNSGGADPIIERADIDTLRRKCGGGDENGRGAIVCNGDEAKDPEVVAIMDKTKKRVGQRVDKAMKRVGKDLKNVQIDEARHRAIAERARERAEAANVRMLEIHKREQNVHAREALERAREQLARIDRGEHLAGLKEALEHSRRQIAVVDVEAIRRSARESARAARFQHHGPSPEEMAELKAEMEELRRELHEDLAQEMRELREELQRELGPDRDS